MVHVLVSLIVAIAGVAVPAILIRHFKRGVVLSSALPSLLVALITLYLEKTYNEPSIKEIPIIFMGASFVGMSASHFLRLWWHICFGAVIFYLLFSFGASFAVGYGGKLGLISCISVLCTIGFENTMALLWKQFGLTKN